MGLFDTDIYYVCPYLSPECGDRGLKNQGCQYGKVCYSEPKEEENES